MSAIYIFGPSCSGKSTLGQALQQRLGAQWTYLDRDQLIESGLCMDSEANKAIEERIQAIKNGVIVDAQIPWREKKKEEVYCLLLPPLEVLLERDSLRTDRLERPEQRAFYAKKYVIETHTILSGIVRENFDVCFNSSQLPIEKMVVKVLQFL